MVQYACALRNDGYRRRVQGFWQGDWMQKKVRVNSKLAIIEDFDTLEASIILEDW